MSLQSNRNFRLIIFGWNISSFGTMLQEFGFSLLVLMKTGSALKFSVTLIIQILPEILFAPLSGTVSDRANRKILVVFYDLMSAVVLAVVLAFVLSGGRLSVYAIYLCVFVLSSLNTFIEPCQNCLFQLIPRPEEFERAKSLNAAVKNTLALAAPAAAGFLYSLWGIVPILAVNALSFALSAFFESRLTVAGTPNNAGPVQPFFRSFGESLAYVSKQPFILSLLLTFGVLNFVSPVVTIGAPVLANRVLRLGAGGIGVVSSLIAGSYLAGSLLAGVLARKNRTFRFESLVRLCVACVTAGMLLTAAWLRLLRPLLPGGANPPVLVALNLLIVIPVVITQIHMSAEFQRVVPNAMMGRATALVNAVLTGSIPLGQLAVGLMLAGGRYDRTFWAEGAVCALLLLYVLARRPQRITDSGQQKA